MKKTPKHLLIVDDNPGDARLAKEVLRESSVPCEASLVSDGEKALAFLRREPPYQEVKRPDLILLDINLPRVSGLEVLEALKSDPQFRAIPIVILTTSQSDMDMDRAYSHHANSYVVKPLHLDDFARLIDTLLDYWVNIVRLPDNDAGQ